MTNITADFDPLQRYAKQRRRSSLLSSILQSPRQSISEELPYEQTQLSQSRLRRNTKPFVSTITPQQRDATLRTMVDRLTYTIYQLVSWSLFAQHQLLFSFLLTATVEREANIDKRRSPSVITPEIIQEEEDESGGGGGGGQEDKKDEHEHEPEIKKLSFITQDEWTCFMSPLLPTVNEDKLSFVNEQVPSLYPICHDLLVNTDQEFFKHSNPYLYLTRHENYSHLSRFRCILLIKILRPDMLLPSISQYVAEQMGHKFLPSGFADIQDIYTHSSPQAPIILLLSPGRFSLKNINEIFCFFFFKGTDPTSLLLRFAKETRGSASHLDVISLGQGQGPKVEEVLSKALTLKGRWIFLHNCHLSASFMPRLRVLVNKYDRFYLFILMKLSFFL
jgi:dynein heavy chain